MRKDNISFEDKLKRLHVLSGIKPINEEARKGTQSTVVESHKINGLNYAIVKESGSYYLKTTSSDIINESTLGYIGGEANRREFKFNSYADALKHLNLIKQVTLSESAVMVEPIEEADEQNFDYEKNGTKYGKDYLPEPPEEIHIKTEQLEKDINPAPQDAAPMPSADATPAIPQDAAPMPSPEPAPAPAPAPTDGGVAPGSAPDSALMGGDETGMPQEDQIDHFVGKLTGEIRNEGDEQLTGDRLKGILNSVLAAMPLDRIDPESRLEIAKRVKDGKSHQENGGDENDLGNNVQGVDDVPVDAAPQGEPAPAPAPEPSPAPEEEPVHEGFNETDDMKINEFFHNNRKAVIMEGTKLKVKNMLVEFDGNKVTLSKGDKAHTYLVSEKTIGKLNQLKEHKATKLMNEEIAQFFKKKI